MNTTSYWIISFIIILVNIADLHSVPFGEFYFPDKFEKVKQYYPTQLNLQLIFDRDYHVSGFDNQRSDNTDDDNDNSNETPQNNGRHLHADDCRMNNGNADTNGGDNNNDFDSQNNDNSNEGFNNHGNNNGHFDRNFDGENGNNNNNGFPRDFPAISNTVCETRCNKNVTPQYNPICGTDGLTYYNSGRMNCAQICGKSVKFVRMGSCSSALISN